MSKLGIFGGTFDPIHYGHLKIAQNALETYDLRGVLWIPQLAPFYKDSVTPIAQRWAMVELAIAPYPYFSLPTTLEIWQDKHPRTPDYAIDTFCCLQELYPGSTWFWILGADSFLTLPKWQGREVLIPACTWLVAARNLPNSEELQAQLQQVAIELQSQGINIIGELLPREAIDISSSLVRQTRQTHQSLDHLLPAIVEKYITEHDLYSSDLAGD